jgi:hypothetical protein
LFIESRYKHHFTPGTIMVSYGGGGGTININLVAKNIAFNIIPSPFSIEPR